MLYVQKPQDRANDFTCSGERLTPIRCPMTDVLHPFFKFFSILQFKIYPLKEVPKFIYGDTRVIVSHFLTAEIARSVLGLSSAKYLDIFSIDRTVLIYHPHSFYEDLLRKRAPPL